MADSAATARAITDLAVLRGAFAAAGWLDPDPPPDARASAGGLEQAQRLRRDLLLADAFLRNRVARGAGGPRHVVVFGGTKVGKSSVVNILAAEPLAAASPEGGFTRFPWAFAAPGVDPLEGRPHAFTGFARVTRESAAPDRFAQVALVPRAGSALPRRLVLWDTPDCDSVGAERWLAGLAEALSLADLVVYVTSVEKYAVASLVEWVFELRAAGLALLECLNKTPRRDRAAVQRRQQDDIFPRMARERGEPPPDMPIVALRVMIEGEEADLWNGTLHPEADELRAAVLRDVAAVDEEAARRAAAADVCRRTGRVLDVVRAEQAARAAWETAVQASVTAFLRRYQEQYLASGEVIEPFMRLNIEILRLLDYDNRELHAALQFVRRVTTLPTRIAIHVGRHILSALAEGTPGVKALPPQAQAFTHAHADLLNALGRVIDAARAAPAHHPFWDRLGEAWQAALPGLHESFGAHLAEQLRNTVAEIHIAAEAIVGELRRKPGLVGTLKGVRLATQAGAVVVGFLVPHGGGMVHDLLEELIITPLLLGATEKSADWLVGSYVQQRRRELVARLQADAEHLADALYRAPLRALADAAVTLRLDAAILERLPRDLAALGA